MISRPYISHPYGRLLGQIFQHFISQSIKYFFGNWLIKLIPINRIASDGILNNEFVFWRSSGEFSGINTKGTGITQATLCAKKGGFY